MPGNLHKGLCFETEAEKYLQQQGLLVLQRGYRSRFGEIDLILRDGESICFVEVKYRKSNSFGGAAWAITAAKQCKLVKTAQFFIANHRAIADCPLRFDALLIQRQADGSNDFDWIKNAFYAE